MASTLRKLELFDLPGFTDLSPLAELRELEKFSLDYAPGARSLQSLRKLENLKKL